MTEDEAKTKICCGPPQVAAQMMRARPAYCAGSACMAWRWNVEKGYQQMAADWTPADTTKTAPHGFCGLAGRP
jgi:hypothetical protein